MNRKELDDARTDITKEIGETILGNASVESKFMSSVLFMLEGILTELEYMNDSRDAESMDKGKTAGYYKESRGGFTSPLTTRAGQSAKLADYDVTEVKVGGTE